jgi:hypothetical protein
VNGVEWVHLLRAHADRRSRVYSANDHSGRRSRKRHPGCFLDPVLSGGAITGVTVPGHGRPWTRFVIRNMVTNPKYVGCNVSTAIPALRRPRRFNPPEMWIRCENAFKSLLDQKSWNHLP